jgi:hypothetical protein
MLTINNKSFENKKAKTIAYDQSNRRMNTENSG